MPSLVKEYSHNQYKLSPTDDSTTRSRAPSRHSVSSCMSSRRSVLGTQATSANDAIVAQKSILHVDCEYPLQIRSRERDFSLSAILDERDVCGDSMGRLGDIFYVPFNRDENDEQPLAIFSVARTPWNFLFSRGAG